MMSLGDWSVASSRPTSNRNKPIKQQFVFMCRSPPARITGRQSYLHRTIDELALGVRIRVPRRTVRCVDRSCQAFLERDVFTRDVAVVAQVITERQRAALFVSARLNHVNMVCVRPFTGSVKERTDGIVDMRHVNIAQRGERLGMRRRGTSCSTEI
jgi:hypothetical protein